MKLPPTANPERYVGLYLYDFGTHVSLGYTAAEIRVLRESKEHCDGTAYEVYRVSENGGFELRGAIDQRLTMCEAICFLRRDGGAARRDYEELCEAAKLLPLPCDAELQLLTVHSFDPPDAAALLYPAAATTAIAGWLDKCAFTGGDRVIGGTDVHAALKSADAMLIDSCRPPTLIDYADRPAEEVLAAADCPLQR